MAKPTSVRLSGESEEFVRKLAEELALPSVSAAIELCVRVARKEYYGVRFAEPDQYWRTWMWRFEELGSKIPPEDQTPPPKG
jgi:hypothetical protein